MLINQQTPLFGHDLIERQLELRAAIAAQAVEDITREALRVDADQRSTELRIQISQLQDDGFLGFSGANTFKPINAEASEAGGKIRLGDFAQRETS